MAGISITTIATPWHDLRSMIPLIAAAGYGGIEIGLKTGSYDPRKPSGAWSNNPAILYSDTLDHQIAAITPLLTEHQLPVAAIGSYCLTDDMAAAAQAMATAQALDCPLARVRVPWYNPGELSYAALLANTRARYRDLALMAAETGVSALIEIHDNSICPTASAAMRVLEGLDPRYVGVIFDPGNHVREGFEQIGMAIDLLGPFLRHVHVKDGSIEPASPHQSRGLKVIGRNAPCGEGHLDWPMIIDALVASGYDGWYSLEDFAAEGPESLTSTIAWVQGLLEQVTIES